MLLVLSPSKTLDETTPHPAVKATQPAMLSSSRELVEVLKGMSEKKLATLMEISPKLAALNHARYQSWQTPFTPKNARPAIYMFKGDVYDGLDAEHLSTRDIAYAQTHLRILSGLYGVLRPLDLMQPYRLEMGRKLTTKRGKDLYRFWGESISRSLEKSAIAAGTDTLINLASQEYAEAIDRSALDLREITVHFKEKRGNKLQVIGLMAKRARGMMARHMITREVKTVKGITSFTEGGYSYVKELSDASSLVFVR